MASQAQWRQSSIFFQPVPFAIDIAACALATRYSTEAHATVLVSIRLASLLLGCEILSMTWYLRAVFRRFCARNRVYRGLGFALNPSTCNT